MMSSMKRIIGWLAAAIVVTVLFGTLYIALQQSGRRLANVAPTATAEAQLHSLDSSPAPGVPPVELSANTGVFVIVYRADDQPESGTITLHGALPVVPAGVLDAARTAGVDVVTWQPEPGLRMAVVARSSGGKVVVAGQSLAPYEATATMIMLVLVFGWLGCQVVLGAGLVASVLLGRRAG